MHLPEANRYSSVELQLVIWWAARGRNPWLSSKGAALAPLRKITEGLRGAGHRVLNTVAGETCLLPLTWRALYRAASYRLTLQAGLINVV
jgi:hypothetical protein